MKLSREKVLHMSHQILHYLDRDDGIEYFDDPQEIRQTIVKIIMDEMKNDEAIDALVRKKLEKNRKYIVSVGSVGQPRDYDNRASFTIYDSEEKRFSFRRIEYDIESAAEKVLKNKLERNFAHRLYIGV